MTNRSIHVQLVQHRASDLLMAISSDLPGLVVHGYTIKEVFDRIPSAIKDIFMADGIEVISVAVRDDPNNLPNFGMPAYIADAFLCAA